MATRNLGLNLLLVIAASTMTLLAVEVGVRLLAPQPPSAEWFARDSRYGFFLKKNFHQSFPYPGHNFVMEVATNSRGMRDIELEPDFHDSGKTILLLGDSFVFGYGVNVEDRIDWWLRRALERTEERRDVRDRDGGRGASGVRVINAGVPGWGTLMETKFARDHFTEFRPDLIALVFCANDPDNDQGAKLPVLSNEDSILYRPKMFLRQNSHAYRWLSKQVAFLRHALRMRGKQDTAPDAQSGSIITPEEWERTLQTIRSFHEDYLAFNPAGLLVILASDPENIEMRTHLQSLDNGENRFFLDLGDAYSRLEPAARVSPWDLHWGAAVHRLAGEALFDFIVRRGLLGL